MEWYFLLLLFFVAVLYASVGHGGASGYLALMALFGISTFYMRSSALTLNLFVAGIAFVNFYRGGYFKWKVIYPFLLTSIPMAYLGARIHTDPKIYKIILGVFLCIAVLRMLVPTISLFEKTKPINILHALIIGAFLGFFSGMIGIGGGIILSPILILLHWASLKEAAAASALFIWFNSLAGIIGVLQAGISLSPHIVMWVIIAFIGGVTGSYLSSFKLRSNFLRYSLALVLALASAKLFLF